MPRRYDYALYRILLGSFVALHFAALLPWAAELFSADGVIQSGSASPLFGLMPSVLMLNDSAMTSTLIVAFGAIAGALIVCGRLDRSGALLAAWLLACLYCRNPLIANPSLPLLGWLLLAHALTPRASSAPQPEAWTLPKPTFVALWIVLACAYSYSGWTKLASPSWLSGDAIRLVLDNPLARDHLLRQWLLATPPWVLAFCTHALLWIELLFAPLALVARVRPWLWLLMTLAQLGFLVFLNFADLTAPMLLAHWLCLDRRWLDRWRSAVPAVLYFDGDCAFCHACVRLAVAEAPHAAIQFSPLTGRHFAHSGLAGTITANSSIVLHTKDGGVYTESRAVAQVLLRLGGIWVPLAHLLFWSPRMLADLGYRCVGRLRHHLLPSTQSCPLPSAVTARWLA